MIVYGDPQYDEELGTLLAHLRLRLAMLLNVPSPALDALRTLLILSGQAEQAADDAPPNLLSEAEAQRQSAQLCHLTDLAASAFYAGWVGDNPSVQVALAQMDAALRQLEVMEQASVTVKVPEGFAFYTLYPEQYCAAAVRWLQEHAAKHPRRAVVLGIRTIGTTLAAVVSATLIAHGWQVRRLSVRPTGHPFARRVEISQDEVAGATWGLIVDEGPGQSGSSMAAAAEALRRVGVARERISFFPSHAGEPGNAASDEVRAWWGDAPRYVTPLHELRWGGQTLPDALAAATAAWYPPNGSPIRTEEMGGGVWRSVVYSDVAQWPAAYAPFERTKYRCTSDDGASVLWKFAGLDVAQVGSDSSAEAVLQVLSRRAMDQGVPLPLGTTHGFVATPWIDGVPLTRADATPEVLAHIGRYVAQVAGPPLSQVAQEAATERLRETVYWNVWEALGEADAAKTRLWSEASAQAMGGTLWPQYGDGRLAPHEWLRTPNGQLVKVDNAGHEADHTMVGVQPAAWDVAGAMVEWGLDEEAATPLLQAYLAAGGAPIPPAVLTFYRLAYGAFRMGQSALCANMSAHDPAEQGRLWHAYGCYRDDLAWILHSRTPLH